MPKTKVRFLGFEWGWGHALLYWGAFALIFLLIWDAAKDRRISVGEGDSYMALLFILSAYFLGCAFYYLRQRRIVLACAGAAIGTASAAMAIALLRVPGLT